MIDNNRLNHSLAVAKKMIEMTGVDGIMIGRAALGNPWIFSQVIAYLNGARYEMPSNREVLNTILMHYELLNAEKGEYTAVREMRKHIAWYIKGMKNASAMRNEINLLESKEEVIKKLKEFFAL